MKDTLNEFVKGNYSLSIAIGIAAVIGGAMLAYVTNDSEPWGTIGGFSFALGLIFTVYVVSKKGS